MQSLTCYPEFSCHPELVSGPRCHEISKFHPKSLVPDLIRDHSGARCQQILKQVQDDGINFQSDNGFLMDICDDGDIKILVYAE